MPFVIYHNPEAPRERVLLAGVGEFTHGQGRRVDGDLVRAVLGEVTPEGHYARNVRFRPGVDPEIQAVQAAARAAAEERAAQAATPAAAPETRPDTVDEPVACGYWYDGGAEKFVADDAPAAEDETNEEEQE